jgi:hypothetical protein|tara:strand:+ start:614 stop:796 length:183 start_codon:yes stop_codon:yes gene_type:complete
MKEKVTDLMEMVEQEMLILWADEVSIPNLLKEDLEFVNVIIQGIMLEKHFWNKQMVVGEA